MTDLITYPDLEQGSLEWLEARRGIVTASVMGSLVTPTLKVADNETSRGLTRLLVAERITGHIEPTYTSDAMMRGTLDEPIARDHYREHREPVREFGFMKRKIGPGWLGFSPDGLTADGLIEIKSAVPKIQLARILGVAIEHGHMAQMQAGMLVSGRPWCDYVTWCGGMPMYVQRTYASVDWAAAITEAVAHFENLAALYMEDYTAAVKGLPATERIEHFADLEA